MSRFARGILVGAMALFVACDPSPSASLRPNILLVSIDSLRADHLGSYGYRRNTSPNIDALAAEGVRFSTAIAPAPWTLPSHLTMLTGRHPAAHGVISEHQKLAEGIPTLAEVLHREGYATAAFVAGPYVSGHFGFDRGFDLYDETLVADGLLASHRTTTSPALVDKVSSWVQGHRRNERSPFFIFLHLWDVHYDFAPPPPYDRLFDPDYEGEIDGRVLDLALGPRPDARYLEHVIALYDGEIAFTDFHLGELLRKFRGWGILDDTVVMVTSDHGEEFFEHGRIGHLEQIFDESIHVPLIVRYPPAIEAGRVVQGQVRLMDIAPTLLGLAGLPTSDLGMPADAPVQARDLTPWLRGGFFAAPFPDLPSFPENYGRRRSGIRTDRGKLIRHDDRYFELYNVRPELGERVKETGRSPAILATLDELLREEARWEAWLENGRVIGEEAGLAPGLRQQLESLGYLLPGQSESPGEGKRPAAGP